MAIEQGMRTLVGCSVIASGTNESGKNSRIHVQKRSASTRTLRTIISVLEGLCCTKRNIVDAHNTRDRILSTLKMNGKNMSKLKPSIMASDRIVFVSMCSCVERVWTLLISGLLNLPRTSHKGLLYKSSLSCTHTRCFRVCFQCGSYVFKL